MQESDIEKVLDYQKILNDETNGISWVYGIGKFNNSINWLRCIHMEISELIDSYPWKHWKDLSAEADIVNAKMEMADIMHFLSSYSIHTVFLNKLLMIKLELEKEATVHVKDILYPTKTFDENKYLELIDSHEYSNLLKKMDDNSIVLNEEIYNKFYAEIRNDIAVEFIKGINKKYKFNSNFDLLSKFEKLSFYAIGGSLFEKESKYFNIENIAVKKMYLESILEIYFSIVTEDFNFDLIALYFAKNVLNKFRQDNGYKEGTYKKIWNGKEDNVHLDMMVEKDKNLTSNEIYSNLEKIYKEVS